MAVGVRVNGKGVEVKPNSVKFTEGRGETMTKACRWDYVAGSVFEVARGNTVICELYTDNGDPYCGDADKAEFYGHLIAEIPNMVPVPANTTMTRKGFEMLQRWVESEFSDMAASVQEGGSVDPDWQRAMTWFEEILRIEGGRE